MNAMYQKVDANLNFVDREKEVCLFWKENNIFQKSMDSRKDGPTYTFYDGPPTANGKPHIGHVLTRVIKDMIPRYRTMKGCMVPRKAGWDTHGLPVELEVEKLLGLDGKEQIEEYGLDPFISKCKESVWKYKGMWEDFSGTVGFWADMDDPYVTYHDDFIESEWWALKQIWDKGLLYKGFKIVPYCPRCGTPLSSHEVAQGYKAVKERSAVARFKVKGEDAYFLAWTTTPWTLPSNVALCVNPSETYVKVKAADGYTYYMAQALLDTVLGKLSEDDKPAYEILETYVGTDLEYKEYEPLFACAGEEAGRQKKKAHYVTCDNYVTMTDGTGIVHIAPAFGEDDAQVGRKYDLPFVQFVDGKGNMTEETPYAGLFVKKADPEVIKDLDKEGKLFDAPKFEHDYPFCWRCDTPLIYYARESWFIKMTAVRDDLVRNNKTVNWIPESIGEGRFGNWLENIQDWGISRNRYWGTPLNVWECEGCGHMDAIGSREELEKMSGNAAAQTVELHRPYIDEITCTCPECGGTMKRVPEVIDCWFDSGAMPFAQHHYPFENKDIVDNRSYYPADFIAEGVDQTRGWFFTLHAIATMVFDSVAYKNVISNGLVLDKNGNKMSKRLGNAVDPFGAIEQYGSDPLRWYMITNSSPWDNLKFDTDGVMEVTRKFFGTLHNTYKFFAPYANLDGFTYQEADVPISKRPEIDRWILSELNSLVKNVDMCYADYEPTKAGRLINDFVNDNLSNWYVRLCRKRFWGTGYTEDKLAAYQTLYVCLETVAKLMAPIAPFYADKLYMDLIATTGRDHVASVHLADFPVCNEAIIDKELETRMELAQKVSSMGLALRKKINIIVKQPLQKLMIPVDTLMKERLESVKSLIMNEVNVKEIDFVEGTSNLLVKKVKCNFKILGKKFGPLMKQVAAAVTAMNQEQISILENEGKIVLDLNGTPAEIETSEVEIFSEDIPGWVVANEGVLTVALDTVVTEELRREGIARELVSKIQNIRKSSGFEITDKIKVSLSKNEQTDGAVKEYNTYICNQVLANSLNLVDEVKDGIELSFDDFSLFVSVIKE